MVDVTYHCPYCGAVTSVERDPSLQDANVTRHPLRDREYAATTDDVEAADGIEFVCLGNVDSEVTTADSEAASVESGTTSVGRDRRDSPTANDSDGPQPGQDGCGRTFYLNYRQSPPPTVGPER